MRSVAPLRWYRYAVGEAVQGRPTGVNRLGQTDHACGFWVLHSREELDGAAPVGLALSRPALRSLRENDIPGLDGMLTAAGFPHQPSDAEGGYHYAGDYANPAGRYPRRTVAGLARIREDLDIAIVRYEEAGPQFEGHVTTWTLVEFLEGHPRTGRPAENRTEAVWVALTSANGSRLDPIGRRHPDGVDGDRVRIGRGVGVAFSRPPPARLAEEDVPGLDAIRARIGLLDQPSRDQGGYREGGSWYPKRDVLGLFRLDDDIIIGIVGEYYYEGESTTVFEIARDSARIVSTASMGGC